MEADAKACACVVGVVVVVGACEHGVDYSNKDGRVAAEVSFLVVVVCSWDLKTSVTSGEAFLLILNPFEIDASLEEDEDF